MALALVGGTTQFAEQIQAGTVLDVIAGQGIDTSAAGSLDLGKTTATSLILGRAAMTATSIYAEVVATGSVVELKATGAALAIGFNNATIGGAAATVQAAIDQVYGEITALDLTIAGVVNALTPITISQGVAIDHDGVNAVVSASDHSAAGDLANGIGIAKAGVAVDLAIDIIVAGEAVVPDALWDTAFPATTDAGKQVWFSATAAGNFTLTKPVAAGTVAQKAGIVTLGGTGVSKLNVQIGDALLN